MIALAWLAFLALLVIIVGLTARIAYRNGYHDGSDAAKPRDMAHPQ